LTFDQVTDSACRKASKLGATLGKAVGLLLKGLHARLERFDELERHVVHRRDALRRETLALLARSTAAKK
jgi:hypothetical protein